MDPGLLSVKFRSPFSRLALIGLGWDAAAAGWMARCLTWMLYSAEYCTVCRGVLCKSLCLPTLYFRRLIAFSGLWQIWKPSSFQSER